MNNKNLLLQKIKKEFKDFKNKLIRTQTQENILEKYAWEYVTKQNIVCSMNFIINKLSEKEVNTMLEMECPLKEIFSYYCKCCDDNENIEYLTKFCCKKICKNTLKKQLNSQSV